MDGKLQTMFAWLSPPKEEYTISSNGWNVLKDLSCKINSLENRDLKNRLLLSLSFFQKGMNSDSDESFFLFWTGLMVVSGTNKTMKINRKLQHKLNKSESEIEEMGWLKLVEFRNKYFKEGVVPNIDFNMVKTIRFFYLNLLEYELDNINI